ncbi:hypothetical protein ACM01_46950, partial [Streptomyces viridochromogenes]
AGVVALVVISALAGLRQVVVGPLGVARRSRSRGASATTITRVVLVVTFTVAITSAGITAAANVLDRRRTYALLHLAGTPLRV